MSNRPSNPNGPAKKPSGPPAKPTTTNRPTTGSVRIAPTRPQANRRGAPPPSTNMTPYLIGGLLLVGALVLAFLFLNNNNGGKAAAGTALVETSKGNFKIQLFSDPATKGTVKNFTDKVGSGYFNDKTFHRVEDWVIQGGDPLGTGSGGGDIPGEYSAHSFVTGAVGMASTASHAAKVNDSQWFVVKKDSKFLDNNYDIFGQVIEGMDVVNKIAIGDKMTKITMQP